MISGSNTVDTASSSLCSPPQTVRDVSLDSGGIQLCGFGLDFLLKQQDLRAGPPARLDHYHNRLRATNDGQQGINGG
jgi:hypothetical protein